MKITPEEFLYFTCKELKRIQNSFDKGDKKSITNGDIMLYTLFKNEIFTHKNDRSKMFKEIEELIK